MPKTAEELSQHPDVRQALYQTSAQKPQAQADKGDKFWFARTSFFLLGCAALYSHS